MDLSDTTWQIQGPLVHLTLIFFKGKIQIVLYFIMLPLNTRETCLHDCTQASCAHALHMKHRPRSLRWKNKPKHCSYWFVMREKYCSGWKNKLKKTDYKRSEQDHILVVTEWVFSVFGTLQLSHRRAGLAVTELQSTKCRGPVSL